MHSELSFSVRRNKIVLGLAPGLGPVPPLEFDDLGSPTSLHWCLTPSIF